MPPAAETILDALDRVPHVRREDRLTEVFAYVLRTVPELACWLVLRVGTIPAPRTKTITVCTQGSLSGSGRPDLLLEYVAADGRQVRLLSELKITAGLTSYQETGYAGWDKDAVVLIAPHDAKFGDAMSLFDGVVTWLEVAAKVDQLGSSLAEGRWRTAALNPAAPSCLRCLAELVTLLEREEVGVSSMSVIDEPTVEVYSKMAHAQSSLETFVRMINTNLRLEELVPDSTVVREGRGSRGPGPNWFFVFDVAWPFLTAIDPEAGAHVALESSGAWLEQGIDGPVMYAGFYFATPEGRLPEELRDPESAVSQAPSRAGALVVLEPHRKQAKCIKVLPLAEIAKRAGTITEQAEWAAAWAAQTVEQLVTIGPRGVT